MKQPNNTSSLFINDSGHGPYTIWKLFIIDNNYDKNNNTNSDLSLFEVICYKKTIPTQFNVVKTEGHQVDERQQTRREGEEKSTGITQR